jgi:hypothetical protein
MVQPIIIIIIIIIVIILFVHKVQNNIYKDQQNIASR